MATIVTDNKIVSIELDAQQNSRVYNVQYLIKHDDDGDYYPPFFVSGAQGLPYIGLQLSINGIPTNCYCNNLKPKPHGIILAEQLTDRYTIIDATFTQNQWIENPLMRPDMLRWQVSSEQRDVFEDINGQPPINSAGELMPFNANVSGMVYAATITGYRNTYKVPFGSNVKWHLVNSNTLNLNGVSIPVGQARLDGVESSDEIINGYPVVSHSWTLKFNADGWDERILNAGFNEKSGSGLQPIFKGNAKVKTPWPLDSGGAALAAGYSVDAVTYTTVDLTHDFNFSYFGWHF